MVGTSSCSSVIAANIEPPDEQELIPTDTKILQLLLNSACR
jgi:hypothetical protein